MSAFTAFASGFLDAANTDRYEKRQAKHEQALWDREDDRWRMRQDEENAYDEAQAVTLREQQLADITSNQEYQKGVVTTADTRADFVYDRGVEDAKTQNAEAIRSLLPNATDAEIEALSGLPYSTIEARLTGPNPWSWKAGKWTDPQSRARQDVYAFALSYKPENMPIDMFNNSDFLAHITQYMALPGASMEQYNEDWNPDVQFGEPGDVNPIGLGFKRTAGDPLDVDQPQGWEMEALENAKWLHVNALNNMVPGLNLLPGGRGFAEDDHGVNSRVTALSDMALARWYDDKSTSGRVKDMASYMQDVWVTMGGNQIGAWNQSQVDFANDILEKVRNDEEVEDGDLMLAAANFDDRSVGVSPAIKTAFTKASNEIFALSVAGKPVDPDTPAPVDNTETRVQAVRDMINNPEAIRAAGVASKNRDIIARADADVLKYNDKIDVISAAIQKMIERGATDEAIRGELFKIESLERKANKAMADKAAAEAALSTNTGE